MDMGDANVCFSLSFSLWLGGNGVDDQLRIVGMVASKVCRAGT